MIRKYKILRKKFKRVVKRFTLIWIYEWYPQFPIIQGIFIFYNIKYIFQNFNLFSVSLKIKIET